MISLTKTNPLAVGRFAAVIALAMLAASCGEAPKQQAAPPAPAVTVAPPTKKTVFDFDEYVGRFVAVNSVEVRARVSGYLDKVHFKDGQIVKQGDLLFSIDKRPFENASAQARARPSPRRVPISPSRRLISSAASNW